MSDSRSVDSAIVDAAAAWTMVPLPSVMDLYSIWGSSASDVWVGGPHNTLLHFDGTSWTPTTVSGVGDIAGLWGAASDDVWAWNTGWTGHYNGSTWSWSYLGAGSKLAAISGSSANDVWRVSANGLIEHWNGSSWSQAATGKGFLNEVWAPDSTHAWAFGGYNGSNAVALRWTPSTWADAGLPAGLYGGVGGSSAMDVWVGAPDATPHGAYHWDGSVWSLVQTDELVAHFHARSPNDVWAIGYQSGGPTLDVLHWGGSAWTTSTIGGGVNVTAIWPTGVNQVWLIGRVDTTPVVLHN
jgi:hypothetical protein